MACAADPPLQRLEFSQPLMGTRFRIVAYPEDPETGRAALAEAFQRIASLEKIMTDYDASSELMRLCARAGEGAIPVSPDLFTVLAESQHWSGKTGGAFDVTAGPLIQLWRRARRQRELPDPARLEQARQVTGYQWMKMDPRAQTVSLLKKGMRLDLGGIGKGFAADKALRILEGHGIRRAMIVAGGEVRVGEAPPGEQGWKIGVAPLDSPDQPPTQYLLLRNAAVSTSGDAEQYVVIGGERYSHIVDPHTGLGLTGQRSVTVLARRGTEADPLATALNVLGPDKGILLVERFPGFAVLFVEKTAAGLSLRSSRNWPGKRALPAR
jgi:thiamine biosynthesis lipoprotein